MQKSLLAKISCPLILAWALSSWLGRKKRRPLPLFPPNIGESQTPIKERSFRYSCEGRHFRRSYKINDGSQLKKKKDGHIQRLKKATVFKAVFENKEQELPWKWVTAETCLDSTLKKNSFFTVVTMVQRAFCPRIMWLLYCIILSILYYYKNFIQVTGSWKGQIFRPLIRI